jgi:RHS repeat-associated protein
MTKATSGRYNNVMDFAYDNAGRLTDEDLSVDFGTARTYAVQSDYDAANRRFEITYPDGTVVERDYTDRDQLEEVRYETATIDQRAYDAGMRLDTITSGNGIVTSFGYRDDNLTETITRTGLSGANFTYDYDANKNKLQETINSPMAAYGFNSTSDATYDDEDRLTEWNRDDSNQDLEWDLSLVGDWDQFTVEGTGVSRTHGNAHELTAIAANSLTYDAKGNLAADGSKTNTHNYTWDFDNQLALADVDGTGGDEIEYTYDALGRRVSKTYPVSGTPTTLVFVCTGQQIIAEYAANARASGPLRKYVYASYIDERCVMVDLTALGAVAAGSEELFYYHSNSLYSTAALTDAAGAVQERYAYDAYGAIIYLDAAGTPLGTQASTIAQPHTFTGRRLDDETGLYHYRARYYDAALGRFISRDSLGYVDGMNLYRGYFVPNGLDPLGLFTCDNGARIDLQFDSCCSAAHRKLITDRMCDARKQIIDAYDAMLQIQLHLVENKFDLDTPPTDADKLAHWNNVVPKVGRWFSTPTTRERNATPFLSPPATVSKFSDVFSRLRTLYSNSVWTFRVTCHANSKCSGRKAYTATGGLCRLTTTWCAIHVCQGWFEASDDAKANILIHELTHWGGAEMPDTRCA